MQQQPKKGTQLALLGAAHSLNHSLFVVAPPLLTVIMSDLGVSKLVIGTVATVASLLYGVGALVGGPLGDKIGEAKTITICLAFSGLSTFIMLAAGVTKDIGLYALALILMAAWASLYHPTANSLISKVFKEGRVAEVMGLHGVGGTLGVVLTPTIAWLLGATFGWPWAFVTFGILSMLLALFFVSGRARVRLATFFSCFLAFSLFYYELIQYKLLTATILACLFALFFILFLWLERGSNFTSARESKNNTGGTIIDALKIRELWVLLAFNIAIGLFMKGVELFFPTYLKENRLIDPMWASIAYTMVLAVGVPGQWIGGKAADKVGSKKVLIGTSAGVCVSLFSLLLFPVYVVGIIVFILFYGVSFYAHQPALNSLTGFLSPQNQRGAVYGIFFFTSFGIGSLSQFMAGYMADAYGSDAAFYLLTAFALIALVLSFKLPATKESK